MTKEEYVSLSVEERIRLNKELCWKSWNAFHETNPDIAKPEIPCIIDGVLILE